MPQHDVAALADLADGQFLPIEIEDHKILLFREGATVHAIGATCPHAGAPLAEGVRDGHRIICPWHKATFCLRTGVLLEPPAVDDLPRFAVKCEAGRIQVTLPAEEPEQSSPAADQRLFAIIGAGAAGALAAQTLRQQGFGGRIVMLDPENRVPYDRTLLRKYHLSGQPGAEKTPLQSQSFYHQHAIERRTAEAETANATTKTIHCADGAAISYDAALLATGGRAWAGRIYPGSHLGANVLSVALQGGTPMPYCAQAERSEHGGAVSPGRQLHWRSGSRRRASESVACQVTVVGNAKRAVREAQLGARLIGRAIVGLHRKQGVILRLGEEIQAFSRQTCGRGGDPGRTANGLPADLVVVGFGVAPVAAYAARCPGENMTIGDATTVDATLQAAEGLYAAGDIARFPHHGTPIRVEHWRVAEQAAAGPPR